MKHSLNYMKVVVTITYKKPYEIIKIDKNTGKINTPTLLLMNRSGHIIGNISRYENWQISLVGNGIDEITFDVHKYADGILCPVWDDLIDFKIVEVDGFGSFEISVSYTDNTETVKSIHGQSLEVELAQINLHEFHVNDEDAADMVITEYSKDNYKDGKYIPTVFYNPDDTKHSLLHRVLADAPHWNIGYVTPKIALGEDIQPENSSTFQRTYTVDGDSIYDFLTGTVAEESNVIFTFNASRNETTGKFERTINCYSLCDCINQEDGDVLCKGIGEDTAVFVSKTKLANEITISSNKDNVKNCFRIEGGDDVITDMVRAVNMNGSNAIYTFANFQYDDMSKELKDKIQEYQAMMSSQKTQEEYYGKNGIYTRLCKAYDDLSYYESAMMPDTDKVTDPGEAEVQYHNVVNELTADDFYVAVSSMNTYKDNLFAGVTNNIKAYTQVFLDSRFDLEIIKDTATFSYIEDEETKKRTGTWEGKIRITQHTNEKNVYPIDISTALPIKIKVYDDEEAFAKQKIEKALSSGSMSDIDFDVARMDQTAMRNYFNQYSLNRLESFYDGYDSCLSILMELGQTDSSHDKDKENTEETESTSDKDNALNVQKKKTIYDIYYERMSIVEEIKEIRQAQVDEIRKKIDHTSDVEEEKGLLQQQKKFQEDHDFRNFLNDDDLYKEFCSYRREDTYTNSNYISDGFSTSECLDKAKELVEVATKEAKKACMLQRTVSTSLNNLFALPEFEPLYDKFALYNYIRVKTEDEILKLRLIGIDFSGDSPEKIEVTFSEQIESIDGRIDDLRSIIQQASSMATSYPSTALQAKHGNDAKDEITDIYTNGLNAAKTMLTNNDNNEVTVTESGIICKRMDDEGCYGDKQLRITGNIMAFTDDAWKTVRMAIGETTFIDPTKPEPENKISAYGIVADAVVGKLIAGDRMFIGNKDESVQITGDGITISNGVIKSKDYEKNEETGEEKGSIIDLRDGSFSFAGGGLSYHKGNLVLKDGVIQSANYEENKTGGMIDLTNGNFRFAGGGLSYDGDTLMLKDGVIQSANYEPYESGTMLDLKNGIFDFAGGGLSYNGDTLMLKDGVIQSANYIPYKSGTMLDLKNGIFDFAGGGLIYNHESNLTVTGNIIANSLNVMDCIYMTNKDETKEIIKGTFDNGTYHVNFPLWCMFLNHVDIYGSLSAHGPICAHNNFEVDGNLLANGHTNLTNLYVSDETILSGKTKLNGKTSIADLEVANSKDNILISSNGSRIKLSNHNGMLGEVVLSGEEFRPSADCKGKMLLGTNDYKWKEMWCSQSSINSASDRNLKNSIKYMDKQDKLDGFFMSLSPCTYKFNDGESGRTHFGFISQDVEQALSENNMSALDFAGFCKNLKTETYIDEDGEECARNILSENGEQEYTYSLRYGEFIALNTFMIQKLYKENHDLRKENQDIQERISLLEEKLGETLI